mgnify:FL=1
MRIVLLAFALAVGSCSVRAATLGPELVSNGGFETTDSWAVGSNWQILPGAYPQGLAFHNEGATAAISETAPLIAGHTYRVVYTISGSAGSSNPLHRFRLRGTGGVVSSPFATGDGTFTFDLVAPAGAYQFEVWPGYGLGAILDDVSVREYTP